MAANNAAAAGRQNNNNNNNAAGGGGAGMSNSDHVEFSVRAAEDLYLEGSEATIRRVTADTNYSCLMLKTQRFSSLFRHYAKYHGLRKDDLEYYFVNLLENEDTPESVQLQRGDTIMVCLLRLLRCCDLVFSAGNAATCPFAIVRGSNAYCGMHSFLFVPSFFILVLDDDHNRRTNQTGPQTAQGGDSRSRRQRR
jgi:hypothetical protein